MKVSQILIAILFVGLSITSCEKDDLLETTKLNSEQSIETRSSKKLKKVKDVSNERKKGKFLNPYYVGNIQKAIKKLKVKGKLKKEYEVTANKLYVRFKPKTKDELDELKSIQGLELFDQPLQENDISSIASGDTFPEYYAVTDLALVNTSVEIEILDTLYLNVVLVSTIPQSDWNLIQSEALTEVDAADPDWSFEEEDAEAFLFCDEWHPSGNVKVNDDVRGMIPLDNVKVRAKKWYYYASTYTDSNGNFRTNTDFCGKVTYDIIYENDIWDVRDGRWGQANTEGPNKKGSHNFEITTGKHLGFATVHRALNRYFYKDVAGLRRPHIFGDKLKVSYCHEDGGSLGVFYPTGFEGTFLSHVYIYGFSNGALRPTQAVFGTTVHELGHVSHCWQIGNVQYWQVSPLIQESWARACQWKITEIEYGFSPLRVPGPIQNWFFNQDPLLNNYSPLFIDLEDNFNQNLSNGPKDPTSGYSLGFIQLNVLQHSYGLTSLRNTLKGQKPSGITDAQIEENLQYYFLNF